MLVFRFLIFAISTCAALKLPVPLDLWNLNEDVFNVETVHNSDWFDELKVKPKDQYEVKAVTYNEEPLWEQAGKRLVQATLFKEGNSVKLAKLHVLDEQDNLEFVFFKAVGGSLVLVNADEFNKTLEELGKGDDTGNWVKLDINDENDGGIFKVKRQVLDGLNVVSFTPKEKYLFGSVYDGQELVWEKDGDDGCSLVAVRKLGDEVHLLTLETSEEVALFFVRKDGKWNEVDKDEFDKSSKELKESIPTIEKLVFEVTQPVDEDKFQVTRKTNKGLKSTTANPKPGYDVVEVTFEGDTVWKGLEGETAGSVGVGWDGANVKLVSLKLFSDRKFSKVLYWKNDGGVWKSIEKEEFNLVATDIISNGSEVSSEDNLSNVKPLEEKDVDLDLSDPVGNEYFNVAVGNDRGLSLSDFVPKKGFNLTYVNDNGRPVWTAKDLSCSRVTVYYLEGNPEYAKLFLVGMEYLPLFYVNQRGSWLSFSEGEFNKMFSKTVEAAKNPGTVKTRLHVAGKKLEADSTEVLETSLSAPEEKVEEPPVPLVKLNVFSPPEDTVKTEKYVSVGFDVLKCTPRPGHSVGEVVYGYQKLWHGSGTNKCTEATLYSKNESPEYLVLLVDGHKHYFWQKDGLLSEVKKNEFNSSFRTSVESDAAFTKEPELGKKSEL